MDGRPIIKRYLDLSAEGWKQFAKNLRPLVQLINGSGGEYNLQLRENYFNIYYQGNSLAMVKSNESGPYFVDIHEKFIADDHK